MVVLSCLRPSVRKGRLALRHCIKDIPSFSYQKTVVARGMAGGGHKRTMNVVPSRFEWTRFKDELHYFAMLGLVPMAMLIFYVNVFTGKAQLADIPEDREPEDWEYFCHPFTQFIAKYLYEPLPKSYEKRLHLLKEEDEKRKVRLLERRVKLLMDERQDYKGWYFFPIDKSRIDTAQMYVELRKDSHGMSEVSGK